MSKHFSPTGYWAIYRVTGRFADAVGVSTRRFVLPVVTWNEQGEAMVFAEGRLTPASRRYANAAGTTHTVTHLHPEDEVPR